MTVVHFAYAIKHVDVPDVVERNIDLEYSDYKKESRIQLISGNVQYHDFK